MDIEEIKKNGFRYEITDYLTIPSLLHAYIVVADTGDGKYEMLDSPNHWISSEQELNEYLEETIKTIEKNMREGFLGLGIQPVTLVFDGGVELEIESTESLSLFWSNQSKD